MATLVLQTIGSVVGGANGAMTAAGVGGVVSGVAGGFIDRALQQHNASPKYSVGPRLKSMDGVTSIEGAGIPRVYGRARIGGQMIWSTRFLEQASYSFESTPKNGKGTGGGTSQTKINLTYNYSANFAIVLCEGPIAFVRRIWADGAEIDMTTLPIRIYRGATDQEPDPLIVAKEGAENAPAYRELAYIVFDNLPLASFGNRTPQFTFELVKPVAGLGEMIRAIDVIPGATEAGYLPTLKLNFSWPGVSEAENRHQLTAGTDWIASIDALQALCPNLESVALVVTWFGDDIRAATCTVAPRVDARFKTIGEFNSILGTSWPPDWTVGPYIRATARLVSQIDGRPAYGGTPSDASVRAAIADLKARGLSVLFYPFLMMDIPADNNLPNPYTGVMTQPPYPWRGRITCDPAPGRAHSPDATPDAAAQLASFFNAYRSFIHHYINLCRDSGGVDAFLVGSELIGLTRVRSASGVYPAVAALTALASEAKSILGPATKISYSADWTEYGAHVPKEGELRFPLDLLWSSRDVDFVGVDVYWPLSDWRDGDAHIDATDATSVNDLDYLRSRIASGEGYDWYYADDAAREAQARRSITDGLGKPWVYRQKDFHSWWSQSHYERLGGVELSTPTGWIPQSKPIWIVETGCPAVDRGANAPNIFPDIKSSEGGLPYFSRDGRDDLMQARFLEAMISYFDPTPIGGSEENPISSFYGGPMVDPARIHLWCWDARPFPAFPSQSDVWSDAENWETGHWLNGRLEGVPLDRLTVALADVVERGGLSLARPKIGGFLDGYVLERPMSPREAIEQLSALYNFDAVIAGGKIDFIARQGKVACEIDEDDLVAGKAMTLVSLTRTQESELPHEIALSFADSENNFQMARVMSRRLEGRSARQSEAQAAVITNRSNAQMLANIWLQDLWIGRETAEFSVRPGLIGLQPGDLLRLAGAYDGRLFQIQRITDGAARQISARAVDPSVYDINAPRLSYRAAAAPTIYGPPRIEVLDLALWRAEGALSYVAAFAEPWPGPLAIIKIDTSGVTQGVGVIAKPAMIGDTLNPLPAGPVGRFDRGASLTIRFSTGELSSVDDRTALAGQTTIAIRDENNDWEILSFAHAELVDEKTYRLSRLIRGLGGEEHLAARTKPAGATVVVLNDALTPLSQRASEIGATMTYAIGPADRDFSDPLFGRVTAGATDKALRPYTPTHLQARRTSEGVEISFIRRGRIDSDIWETVDIPLGEDQEAYEAEIDLSSGLRILKTQTMRFLYPRAQELADFGAPQSALSIRIYQMSVLVGRGFPFSGIIPIHQD